MKFSIIQFHASIKELVEFCLFIEKAYNLSFVCFGSNKQPCSLYDLVAHPFYGGRIFIRRKENNAYEVDFDALEKTSLNLDVGAYFEDKIFESSIYFQKDLPKQDCELFGLILKEFRKITKSGVTALNIETGAKSFLKNNRYTDEIVELFRTGNKIIPFGGGKKIFLDFQ